MKQYFICAALYMMACLVFSKASIAQTYTTHFPLAENPISENGNWINGGRVGLDWTDFSTTPGLAIGTQTGSGGYDDSTALLTGSWGPDQTAQARVDTVNQHDYDGCNQELELRLRSSLSAHSATGYEINFKCSKGTWAYSEIVRWNGPLGDFTYLSQKNGAQYGVSNGDLVKATIVGNVINVYINDILVNTATDSTYATGNPGMGVFVGSLCVGTNSDYGFTSYTATDAPHCGDGACDSGESCSSCESDCGKCPVNLPDLVVTDISWSPSNPQTGSAVTFSATIKNQGTGATPNGVVHGVSFTVDSQVYVWSASYTSSFAPGALVTVAANGGPTGSSVWTASAGTHNVEAYVDDVNRIAESNENNNKLTRSLTIGTQTCSSLGGTCCSSDLPCSSPLDGTGCTSWAVCCANGACGSVQECIAGDLNCDKKVDILDLVLVATNFGKSNFDQKADANKDNKIDIFDLVIVAQNFGKADFDPRANVDGKNGINIFDLVLVAQRFGSVG